MENNSRNTPYRLEIPFRLPSLNEYIRLERGHARAGSALKRKTEESIGWILKGLPEPPRGLVEVRFIWYEQTKRRDKDNVAFAKKFVLDAMQKYGGLKNDNNQCIAGFSDEFIYKQGDKVVVEIRKVEETA